MQGIFIEADSNLLFDLDRFKAHFEWLLRFLKHWTGKFTDAVIAHKKELEIVAKDVLMTVQEKIEAGIREC